VTPVGVLGGSFDPVHRGHLALATQALSALGVSRVLLLPCAEPPHKPDRSLAARYHRLEMVYLAVQDRSGLDVSTIEIAKGGLQYTIDTLREIRNGSPPLDPVFVCGSDALADIPFWRDYQTLLAEFDFAAVTRAHGRRAGDEAMWPPQIAGRLEALPTAGRGLLGEGGRIYRMPMPEVAISSSAVRELCSQGLAIDHLVPATVARYIQRHRLYSGEVAS
jgi:nicotinate-nucleotide adenylyltransferase